MFLEQPELAPYDIVRAYWSAQHKGTDFETWWRRVVHDGVVPNTAAAAKTPAVRSAAISSPAAPRRLEGKLEVVFRPDPSIYDGQFANNGWLQELPKPITKLTWDNAAIMSPATAHRLNIVTGDMVRLTYQGRSLNAPVLVQPGHVNGSVTLHLGFGRTHAGHVGNGFGFNVYGLRTAQALWHDTGLDAQKISGTYLFATTQNEQILDTRRHVIHRGDIEEY
jgi:molybdopterin-containing oxidoreductase family iron-sulfur binding subunit